MNAEPVFQVRFRTLSSVYTQDRHVSSFFRMFPSDSKFSGNSAVAEQLLHVVSGLEVADLQEMVRFLVPLLNYQMKLLAARCEDAKYGAFLSAVTVLSRVTSVCKLQNPDETDRCSLLVAYVKKIFDNVDGVFMYPIICRQWIRSLKTMKEEVTAEGSNLGLGSKYCVQFAWFWFEAMIKSMQLELTTEDGTKRVLSALPDMY
eukprot:356114_1